MSHPRENLNALGHEKQQASLLSMIEHKKLAQTLLFHGPQGIGKATLAYQLACYLLGGAAPDDGLFGPQGLTIDRESAAVRRVIAGSHGDLLVIEPEFSGQNLLPVIKVEAARKVAGFYSKTASESDWRVVIVDGADALNVNAANALLKVVEEPPLNALMILIAHHPGRLLPTLTSRCRQLAFRAPNHEQFQQVLELQQDVDISQLAPLYVLSHGSPGQAVALAELESVQTYADILSVFRQYPEPNDAAMKDLNARIEKQAKNGGWANWCQLWQLFLQRVVLASQGALGQAVLHDEPEVLARLYATCSVTFWQELLAASTALISQSHTLHLDRKHVIQRLMHQAFQRLELAA